MEILKELCECTKKGKVKDVKQLVNDALSAGVDANTILNEGLLAGMEEVGARFKAGTAFIPEVLIVARAMNAGIGELKSSLASDAMESAGTAVLGTVKGDLHDIGKNLVKIMLESKGLKVIDLGVDVPAEKFVDAAIENNASVICCSALLTTTMGEMREVVSKVNASELAGKVKIMIGGAPVTQDFCNEIGADAYTDDAASAAEVAVKLCQGA